MKLATGVIRRAQRIAHSLLRVPSLGFSAALAALVALEIPSMSGAFLEKYGANILCGWLAQLVLLSLFVDALRGILPRPFMLIPLLFYGSYYFTYWEQGVHIRLKSEELKKQNPSKVFDFDPRYYSLVIDNADVFAASYLIPVVYVHDASFVRDEYVSYRLMATDRISHYLSRNNNDVQMFSVYWNDVVQPNVRELKFPERPQRSIISVTIRDDPGEGWKDYGIGGITTSLRVQGRIIGVFKSGYVRRLPPLPLFTIGCTYSRTTSKRVCQTEFVTERIAIESRPDSIDRTLYDDPVSIMLGIRLLSQRDMANFRAFNGEAPPRPAPGEDEAFAALSDVVDGRSPNLSWATNFLVVADPSRLAPFAEGMAKRFLELTGTDNADLPGRRQRAELLAAGLAALRPAEFASVQGELVDLARRNSVRDEFPLLYVRLADAGQKLFPIYRDQFLAQNATQQERLLAALAICRIGVADAELVSAIGSEWKQSDSGAGDSDNFRAALFVTMEKLGQEETLRNSPRSSSKALQGWYDAVLAGRGKTDVGPNNCMPMDWPRAGAVPPIMAPRLRWTQQQWRATD